MMNRAPIRLRGTLPPRTARPTPSPMQPGNWEVLSTAVQRIEALYKEFREGIDLVKEALATFKTIKRGDPGMPGSRGPTGDRGKDVTQADVETAVAKMIRHPEAPSVDAIAASIMASGTFYRLIKKRLKEVKAETPAEEKLEMQDILAAVEEMLRSRKISATDIEGMDRHPMIAEIRSRAMRPYDPSPGNARGGGDTVVAGAGVTISNNQNGNKVISATGSGITIKTPTGTVNGSNQVFGVTGRPTFVIADGITYFEGAGYAYAALQITMDVAPSQYIRYAV